MAMTHGNDSRTSLNILLGSPERFRVLSGADDEAEQELHGEDGVEPAGRDQELSQEAQVGSGPILALQTSPSRV